jgi:hypothetical protein
LTPLLDWLITRLEPLVDLHDIVGSFDRVEAQLMDFERWLHTVWGQGFYELLSDGHDHAIPQAYKIANNRKGNVLICDGFSVRELILLKTAFTSRVNYQVGKAPAPTTTANVTKTIFQTSNLKDALTGTKLYEGQHWHGDIITDITKPPRIGNQHGLMFLTYYPDAPLHHAISYGTAFVQDVSNVMKQIIELIRELATNTLLVVTGDHGYIYTGDNPNKFLWLPYTRQQRFGEEYRGNYLNVDGVTVAVGRFHAPITTRSKAVICHGGVSLTESLVPVVTIEAEV